MTFDSREAFAQLRSLMNTRKLGKAAQRELWELVLVCSSKDPDAYQSHWLDYMKSFAHHWEFDALTFDNIVVLEAARKLLPFARFSLNFQNKSFTDPDINRILKTDAHAHVSSLYLTGNAITDKGAKLLARSTHFTSLEELYLGRNQIGDEGVAKLVRAPWCNTLTKLDLQFNQIGNAGATALANATTLSGLKTLYLSSNRIELEGARALAASEPLGGDSLATRCALYMDNNPLGALGTEALIGSKRINLKGNIIARLAMEEW